ncbi:hypothetical protein ASG31_13405 [Chryseobacterium sp. Leaf404]|uniref:hypothetical protein n=1 Tax=unclassified Chryseobacterium TaxID=2593645 RepID=UPI0006F4E0FC|nr:MULTISPECIES: hypothetical protein [unclassified Chryseobacterium]KQT16502.1 hypothetical protein ASG31_13405 [Chryseobacterium sp. Leaf404]
MKNLKEKLADLKIEQLEERKEFTFYTVKNCNPQPPCGPTPPTTPPANPGNGGGNTGGGW